MSVVVGVPKEVKNNEFRVGMTPDGVRELINSGDGISVIVECGAGLGSGFEDSEYVDAGAIIEGSCDKLWEESKIIIKVKEPQPEEYGRIQSNQILFTYLHLAPDLKQQEALIESNCIAIAYETIRDKNGELPLLKPMSEVAGRLSIQAGARFLEKPNGGSGALLGGVPSVDAANVLVIGAGIVGFNAVQIAVGMGANVTVLDRDMDKLRYVDHIFGNRVSTRFSTSKAITDEVKRSDLVIGSVLIPGANAPKLVTKKHIKSMKKGSVVVDVAIDQGGCFETSEVTTHENPTYVVDDVIHYCVSNMPGAVPRTSTLALTNATLKYIIELANNPSKAASDFYGGVNIRHGQIICEEIKK